MKRRGNPYPHRYKDKQEETLTQDEYLQYLENSRALEAKRKYLKENPTCIAHARIIFFKISALLALIYYLGLRVSEIVGDKSYKYKVVWRQELVDSPKHMDYPEKPDGIDKKYPTGFIYKWTKQIHGLRKQDMRITKTTIRIDPKEVRKHGKRDEPLWIPLELPGAKEIEEQWHDTKDRNDRVFPISTWTAWSLISQVTEGRLYPQYFRENRATKFAENPKTSIYELQQWFGWRDPRTIAKYMGKAGRVTRGMAKRLK